MDYVLELCLQITRIYVVIPLVIVGLVFLDRKTFQRALLILLLGMILNILLKDIFQVPLKAHLSSHGYAFPSGHAQTAITFYGYLAYQYRNPLLSLLIGALLIGVCCALVHFNYHNWIDVFAAGGFSVLTILIFDYLEQSKIFRDNFFIYCGLLTVGAFLTVGFLNKPVVHSAVPLGGMAGLSIGVFLEKLYGYSISNKILEFIIIVFGVATVYAVSQFLGHTHGRSQLIAFAIMALWANFGPQVITGLRR